MNLSETFVYLRRRFKKKKKIYFNFILMLNIILIIGLYKLKVKFDALGISNVWLSFS